MMAHSHFGGLVYFLLWFAVFAFFFSFVIHFTRARLIDRVGIQQNREEIQEINEKVEKYNIW
jgi:uncharacterized membrane protein (DUF106 family)